MLVGLLSLVGARTVDASGTATVSAPLEGLPDREADDGPVVAGFIQAGAQWVPGQGAPSFTIDEIELRFEKAWRAIGTGHAELQLREADQRWVRQNRRSLGIDELLDEVWVSVDHWNDLGFRARLGRAAMPFGVEPTDGPGSLTYSRSWTVEVGRPSLGTGLFLEYARQVLDASLFVVNGWDALVDQATSMSIGGRFGLRFAGDRLRLGASYLGGQEPVPRRVEEGATLETLRHFVDLDFAVATELLDVRLELAWSRHARASQVVQDRVAQWLSFVGLVRYAPTGSLAFTVRFEHADDAEAAWFPNARPQLLFTPTATDSTAAQLTVEAVTFHARLALSQEVKVTLEYRGDFQPRAGDVAVFPAAEGPRTTRHLVALGFLVELTK